MVVSPGPRIVAVTRAIAATGCYGPSGSDPRWAVPQGAEETTGVGGVRAAVLRRMRGHGVALCPTLAANAASARYAGWQPGTPEPARLRDAHAMFARAPHPGVTIACGRDGGVFPHGDNVQEIELMVAYGMRPADALRAATTTAARVLGRQDELGRVAVGFVADLVAVAGDPLADPAALRRPAVVLSGGCVVVDRR